MKPSAFLTLLNCSSFMVLVPSLSFTCRHEALLISLAQARNGRPIMPTCGQVFARLGVVVGAPDAGSVDLDECVDGVAPIGHPHAGRPGRHRLHPTGGNECLFAVPVARASRLRRHSFMGTWG